MKTNIENKKNKIIGVIFYSALVFSLIGLVYDFSISMTIFHHNTEFFFGTEENTGFVKGLKENNVYFNRAIMSNYLIFAISIFAFIVYRSEPNILTYTFCIFGINILILNGLGHFYWGHAWWGIEPW